MGLIMKRKEDGAKIPAGEKLSFRITDTRRDDGDFGPQARLELEAATGKYKGATLTEWAKLAQPRTDFVQALRRKDYSDEKIAEILVDRGFVFDDIDEYEDEVKVGQTGKLMNICMAAFHGDLDAIDGLESIEDLLEELKSKSFQSITKARGAEGKYTGITWDMIYPDPVAAVPPPDEPEEDFDNITF